MKTIAALFLLVIFSSNLSAGTATVRFTENGMSSYNVYISDMSGNVTETPIKSGPNSPIIFDVPDSVDEIIVVVTGVNGRGQSKYGDWAYDGKRPSVIDVTPPQSPAIESIEIGE